MEVREVLCDFVKGKHTLGQMLNLFKYFCGKKKEVVNWEPIYISVFPTFRCNLTCDMCLTHSKKFKNPFGQKPGKDVDFELFKQILNRYKNALAVNLIGNGESLLNKDFFRMIEYASNVKMYTFSGSNGILVGEYVEEIINSPLTGFIISINGHNSTEFNRMTGMPGKWFDTICDNTVELVRQRDLKKSKLEILVSIILDKENYKYLKDMIYFVEKLGVNRALFFQFLASPAPGFTAEERCLFSDDLDVVEAFAQVKSLPPRIRRKVTLPPLLGRQMDNNKYCSVPSYNLSLDGDGNVGGCSCQLLDLSGNGKFFEEDAWNNAHFKELRKRFIDPEFPLLEPCRWCYNNVGRSRLVSNPNPLSYLMRQVFRRLQK
ncbi:MAG: Coenzyme PQQ synthesis protein E [candidate division WS2 bacterium]|nr:Coenzyme PQQ synthesis protein E [Candidatus Psychracetigena formicireducens]